MAHRLRIAFAEAAVFREEYERDIVKGGVFIRTAEEFQPRDLVEVELEFGFCGESVVLEAEIVHCVRAEEAGSEPGEGFAVQFLESVPVLREHLEHFIEKSGVAEAEPAELEFDEAEPAELEFDEAEPAELESAEAEPAELEFAEAEPAELESAEVAFAEAESAEPAGRALFSEEDISGLNLEGMFEESGLSEEKIGRAHV